MESKQAELAEEAGGFLEDNMKKTITFLIIIFILLCVIGWLVFDGKNGQNGQNGQAKPIKQANQANQEIATTNMLVTDPVAQQRIDMINTFLSKYFPEKVAEFNSLLQKK